MTTLQAEFKQVIHRIGPYHPGVILVAVLLLSAFVVALNAFSLRQESVDTRQDSMVSVQKLKSALDRLEAYQQSTMPLDNVKEVFARNQPPAPGSPPEEIAPPPSEPGKIPELELNAVFRTRGRPLADINGKLYGVGDAVDEVCRIRIIHLERVILEMEDGRMFTLELYGGRTDQPE